MNAYALRATTQLSLSSSSFESIFMFCIGFHLAVVLCVCGQRVPGSPFTDSTPKSQLLKQSLNPHQFSSVFTTEKVFLLFVYVAASFQDQVTFLLAQRVARGRSYYKITCLVDSVNKSPACETHCCMIVTQGQGFRKTQKRRGTHLYVTSNQTCNANQNNTTTFRNEDNTGFRVSVNTEFGDLPRIPLA